MAAAWLERSTLLNSAAVKLFTDTRVPWPTYCWCRPVSPPCLRGSTIGDMRGCLSPRHNRERRQAMAGDNILAQIHEGMRVQTADGQDVGKITQIWFGTDPSGSSALCDEELCSRLEVH